MILGGLSMKFSQSGKYLILAVFCLGVGFISGQYNMEKAINLEGMKEAHYFGVHASYLRGCTENKAEGITWQECVKGAQNATQDVRDIMEQEPTVIYVDPQGKEIRRHIPESSKKFYKPETSENQKELQEIFKQTNKKPIMI